MAIQKPTEKLQFFLRKTKIKWQTQFQNIKEYAGKFGFAKERKNKQTSEYTQPEQKQKNYSISLFSFPLKNIK
jgi:hypothetical protein